MIEQYLSNTNESATMSISQKFLKLNKASTSISQNDKIMVFIIKHNKMTIWVEYYAGLITSTPVLLGVECVPLVVSAGPGFLWTNKLARRLASSFHRCGPW